MRRPADLQPPSWLDVMPPIRLERAVPVVIMEGHRRTGRTTITNEGVRGESCLVTRGLAYSWRQLRVDLDHPQGFGFALRWLHANAGALQGRAPPHPMLNEMPLGGRISEGLLQLLGDGRPGVNVGLRHSYGLTTSVDRLALAKACAEVAP